MPSTYMSLKTSGVDTKAFYRKAGCTMVSVSKETGICRAALSRLPVHKCSEEVAQKVLECMERENRKRYTERIENLRCELEEAWKEYQDCDYAMIEYRKEFEIKRKYPRLKKIELKEVPFEKNDV